MCAFEDTQHEDTYIVILGHIHSTHLRGDEVTRDNGGQRGDIGQISSNRKVSCVLVRKHSLRRIARQ